MGQPVDLDKTFDAWYNELENYALRSERLEDDLYRMVHDPAFIPAKRLAVIRQWLRAAYQQGARDMAQDTVDTLGDYATAVSGLEEPLRNPTQGYDAARDNLMTYYTQVLDESRIKP